MMFLTFGKLVFDDTPVSLGSVTNAFQMLLEVVLGMIVFNHNAISNMVL